MNPVLRFKRALQLLIVTGATLALASCATSTSTTSDSRAAQARAIAYLAREVPAWHAEHGCYSCHNNGDAASALLWSSPAHRFDLAAELKSTVAWLSRPQDWHENKGDPAYSDFKLARLQFGGALANAERMRWITNRAPLREAARQIALDQNADGSWKIESDTSPGSPVTYGNALATIKAASILRVADNARFEKNINSGADWLRGISINNVPQAAAIAMWFGQAEPYGDRGKALQALDYLRRAQSSDIGGWGPYPGTPSEVFDTALAVMAMDFFPKDRDARKRAKRGREYLLSHQLPDGGWPETTRPSGGDSYAQHISTTAWALMAVVSPQEIHSARGSGDKIIGSQTERPPFSPRFAP